MDRRQLDVEAERHWRRLTKPMPRLHARINCLEAFTEREGERLLRSVLPQRMEDKWIVLLDDLFTLNFYRSWTGFHIYSVTFVTPNPDENDPNYWTAETIVNRDPEQHLGGNDALEVARVSWLIRTLLLHQDVPIPVDPSASRDAALLDQWSFAGRASFGTQGDDPDPKPEGGGSAVDRTAPHDDRTPPDLE